MYACTVCSSLTGLFDHEQDRLAAGVFIILETLHAIVLVFVRAVHSISIMEHCMENGEKMVYQSVKTKSSKAT